MKIKHVFSAAALSLVASIASAGLVQPVPVTIDFAARLATGDMWSARTSANPFEFIGCGVRHNAAGMYFGFCQAGLADADAQRITCFTDNPQLIDAIKSIGDYSYIAFRWDADGMCTHVGVSTQSFYLPKK